MDPVTLEDVRNEVSRGLDTAIARVDWDDVLKGTIAKMAQDPPAPSETGLARLNEWATARGDRPLGDDELIHLTRDGGVETFTALEVREHAVMRQAGVIGAALTFDEFGGLGIPFGSVLLGGIPGIIVGDVIDGLVSPQGTDGNVNLANVISKAGIAAAGAFFLPRWIGNRPAMFFAGALVVQVLSDMLPLDRFSAWVVDMFSREAPAEASYAEAAAAQRRAAARAAQGDIPIDDPTGANPLLVALGAR